MNRQRVSSVIGYRRLASTLILLLAFVPTMSLAEELIVQAEDKVDVVQLRVQLAPMQLIAPAMALNADRGDWFQSWVFGGVSSASARKQLENALAQKIALIKTQCEVTDEQIAKLELAQRGDIVRFFQQVDEVRHSLGAQRPDRGNMAEITKAIGPVQQRWNAGVIGTDSLFFSILQSILDDKQKEALRLEGKRRLEERYRFHAMSMIKMIEHSIPLTDKQRQRLLELVMEQTMKVHLDAHFEQYISLQAATKLSDETLGSFMDTTQLDTFRQLQKHWETNIPFLNQMIKQPRSRVDEEWMDVLQ